MVFMECTCPAITSASIPWWERGEGEFLLLERGGGGGGGGLIQTASLLRWFVSHFHCCTSRNASFVSCSLSTGLAADGVFLST